MSIGGLIVLFLAVALVALIVGVPLFLRPKDTPSQIAQREREQVQIAYDRVVRNLRDLDEDHALGKLNTQHYYYQREQLAAQGTALLQRLDSLPSQDDA
jgi:hypothetical protein